jgi:WD40 repeat protein
VASVLPAFATTGAVLWAKRYNGPGSGGDVAWAMAVNPAGTTVFVTGESFGSTSNTDYATLAYNAATGAVLWAKRYNGPANNADHASAIAVSPDGTKVFVTGGSVSSSGGYDYATIAYNAATGAMLWTMRYNRAANLRDEATQLTVSPDGTKVFVTGVSTGSSSHWDYTTIAYTTGTGAMLWTKLYNGPGNGDDDPYAISVSPDSTKVFVTGYSRGSTSGDDYATLAYNAATGAVLWAKRYNDPSNGYDQATALKVSPDGTKVFVTGYSIGSETIAYSAATGAVLWAKQAGSGGGATALGVSPDGTKVFITGSMLGTTNTDYGTIAYNSGTGAVLWAKQYNGPANGTDLSSRLAVSPDGTKVFVTGNSEGSTSGPDYATVAYSATTGGPLWSRRYTGPGNSLDYPLALAATNTKLFVTGQSQPSSTDPADYVTIAYSTT